MTGTMPRHRSVLAKHLGLIQASLQLQKKGLHYLQNVMVKVLVVSLFMKTWRGNLLKNLVSYSLLQIYSSSRK